MKRKKKQNKTSQNKKTPENNPFGKFIKKAPSRAVRRKKLNEKRPFLRKSKKEPETTEQRIQTPVYNSEQIKTFQKRERKQQKQTNTEQGIRLNRYVSNSGVCARREADQLIFDGKILVNDTVIREPGYRIYTQDHVKYQGKVIQPEKFVYVLLNKPKDHITTLDDPQGRKTVMNLVRRACDERIFPVGRLDRNTTGLLLLTNDGKLAEKLAHPSQRVKKEYQAELNKPITPEDAEKIQEGIELEDGKIQADELYYFGEGNIVGIKLHSGKNRIVRRIFEHLGYEVLRLDRIGFADLTKKNIPRGKWRYLSEKEVIRLKYIL